MYENHQKLKEFQMELSGMEVRMYILMLSVSFGIGEY